MKPPFSHAQIIGQIDSGFRWQGDTITYQFPTDRQWLVGINARELPGASPMNEAQVIANTIAIEQWDDIIAPDLLLTHTDGDIRFMNSTTGILGSAHAYFPNGSQLEGSVWYSPRIPRNLDPQSGEFSGFTVIHEIGHALGFSHPGPYNISATFDQQVYAQDTMQYTTMSYFVASASGSQHAVDGKWVYPQTPMLHDVMVSQSVYGADMTTRTEDTTYGYNSTETDTVFDFTVNVAPVLTIWDAGGNDTLDLSGWAGDVMLDLNQGAFSSTSGMSSNIAIAFGAEIENAVGGLGDDYIIANGLDNLLTGGGGDDLFMLFDDGSVDYITDYDEGDTITLDGLIVEGDDILQYLLATVAAPTPEVDPYLPFQTDDVGSDDDQPGAHVPVYDVYSVVAVEHTEAADGWII